MTQNTIATRKKTDKRGDINKTVVDIENKLIVTKGDGGDGGDGAGGRGEGMRGGDGLGRGATLGVWD